MAHNEADITSYIQHLLETIGQEAPIQRDFLLEHIAKHFRNSCPRLNILVTHHAFKCKKDLVEVTHRVIEVPWCTSPNGKIEVGLDLFKSGSVTFEDEDNKESVFYDGKFTKNGNRIDFTDLNPVDPWKTRFFYLKILFSFFLFSILIYWF